MKLGSRIEIVDTDMVNCANIPFQGLFGTVIAKARSTFDPDYFLWLVSFDRDICGLVAPGGCDHDFHRRARDEAYLYVIMEGDIAPRIRNQHFFTKEFLKLVDVPVFAPKNNDGRTTCFRCGAPTKRVPGISVNNYDICTRCGK